MTSLPSTRTRLAAGLALAAALARERRLRPDHAREGQGRRLRPRRLRQRGALRLRHARRQADRRGARGGEGGARQDGHHPGRRRADRVRLADPRPQGRPLRHHRRRHVREPARCDEIAFSEPSYGIGQAILVPAGNPKGIVDYASFADNADLKLAVMAGAVEGGYAKDAGVGFDPGRQPARPGEPRRRGAGRPRRRRRALRALDRRHGVEGRRASSRPSPSARSPASRSRATAPSASARRTRTSSTPSTPS